MSNSPAVNMYDANGSEMLLSSQQSLDAISPIDHILTEAVGYMVAQHVNYEDLFHLKNASPRCSVIFQAAMDHVRRYLGGGDFFRMRSPQLQWLTFGKTIEGEEIERMMLLEHYLNVHIHRRIIVFDCSTLREVTRVYDMKLIDVYNGELYVREKKASVCVSKISQFIRGTT